MPTLVGMTSSTFPTELPEALVRFLDAHPEAQVAVVAEPVLSRLQLDDTHWFLSAFDEAPLIKQFGRDAHVDAIHAVRAARVEGTAHVIIDCHGTPTHLSAASILGTEYLVIVMHPTSGIGPLTDIREAGAVTVFRGTCDPQLHLLSLDDALVRAVDLPRDQLHSSSLNDLVDSDSVSGLIDCWVDATALGAASSTVQLRNSGPNDPWFQITLIAHGDRTDFVLVDAEETVRASQAKEHRTRLRNIAETVPHGIFRVSSDGQLLYKNSKLDDIFSREFRTHDDFGDMRTVDGTPLHIAVPEMLTGEDEGQFDIVHVDDEAERTIRLRVRQYFGASGKPEYVGSAEDVTQEIERKNQLELEALTDPMTGAANRRSLELRLASMLESPERRTFAVLLCDLDGFKQVNDSLGHGAGDDVIAEVGRRLQEVSREGDMVARLGGDEFVVVAKDMHNYDQAMEFADRILPLLRKPFSIADTQIELSGSVGVALSAADSSVLGILQMADHAMYEAKRAGRNQTMPYHSPDSTNNLSPLALRRDLRRAIAADGLDLAFQPIFAIDDLETPESAEALLRWNHPLQGRIDPGTMISIAEQSGLIRDLGEWIVTEAIRSASAVNEGRDGSPISIAVNVSALQVGRPEFVDMVAASLDFHKLEASLLTLELTESHLIDRVDNARPAIAELSEMGVRLAVDDFGTGASTFEYLLSLPMYAVKIDPSFTKRLTEPRGAAMLRGLSSACRELDMHVIVEGIETFEQLNAARKADVTHAQGYLLGMPVSTTNLGMRDNAAA